MSGIPVRLVQRHRQQGKFKAYGDGSNFRVDAEEAKRYLAAYKGIELPVETIKTNGHVNGDTEETINIDTEETANDDPVDLTKNRDPVKSNGKRYDVDDLISRIATGDPLDAKTAKDQAQALKLALEVQKRRKEDGELISIDQYRINIARLGQKVRNLANSIADGFLGEIDGMTAPQIQNSLEIRIEEYLKRLSELEWEDDEDK